MKKFMTALLAVLSTWSLSGCTAPLQEETFSYYDAYYELTVKYFDSYAVVYENADYDLTLFAVKSSEIVDGDGNEYVNYILKWNIDKLDTIFRFSCGSHGLWSGISQWNGTYMTHLIPGQEVHDYCQPYDFTLTIQGEHVADIGLVTDANQAQLAWMPVADVGENNLGAYLANNRVFILTLSGVVLGVGLFVLAYLAIYRKNCNNFVSNKKVTKLPGPSVILSLSIMIGLLTIIALVSSHEAPSDHYDNNFYDYVRQEESTLYLPEFDGDGQELIGSAGMLEVYIEKNGTDDIVFTVVLVDGDERYLMETIAYSFSNAANCDRYRVELHQKQKDDDGYAFGYIVEAYEDVGGEEIRQLSFSLGVTEEIDGTLTFIDFMDSTNMYDVYYMNAKGYYKMSYIVADYFQDESK
ncbi:MAG: hypothetical protein WC509_05650 [Candidatus Izemoplasmatales bacterium]